MAKKIHLSPPDVGDLERAALLTAFDGGWIAPTGPELDGFEHDLAAYTGAPACAAVSSGTAALRLGLELLGIGRDDEVVVATATFAASAFAVAHAGATPVFCDVEASTWCLDPDLLADFLKQRAKIGRLPKVVMPVALYGSAPNYRAIIDVCGEYGVPILEDAAEALGSISTDGPVGSLSHLAVFSFNGNKIITTSSGGALVGSDAEMRHVRHLATQARQNEIHYEHTEIGFNFRLSNLLAAMGRAQLSRIEHIVERLGAINAEYRRAFPDFEYCPYAYTPRPNHWLTVGLLPEGNDVARLAGELNARGIDARPAWKPMHQQPIFASAEMIGSGAVADDIFARGLCLPSGSTLESADLDRVVAEVRQRLVS